MQAKVFQYVIVENPTSEERKGGATARLVTPQPVLVVAVSEQQAALLAGRGIPEELVGKMEKLEVLIRPF